MGEGENKVLGHGELGVPHSGSAGGDRLWSVGFLGLNLDIQTGGKVS